VQAVIDAIDGIGEVSLASEADVEGARSGYESLTDDQAEQVGNLDVLEAAEAELSVLRVNQCIDLIDAIGEVTLESKESVQAARESLDSLTADEREAVANVGVLEEAEGTLSALEEAEKRALESHSVGESVETDTVRLTLDRAELAVALDRRMTVGVDAPEDGYAGGSFFLPKEYDSEEDGKNPFVASKGHTLVSMTITIENIDRGGSVDTRYMGFAVAYDGQNYAGELKTGAKDAHDGKGWQDCVIVSNELISAGETCSIKAYIDIPVEVDDLSSPFKITFTLPSSTGTERFTYAVN